MLDMDMAREVFDSSADFSVGIEEEFAILDPHTRDLTQRFEELREVAEGDGLLSEGIAGELIASEIEIRSGRGADLAEALARQQEMRAALFRLAAERGVLLGSTGTHPWSPWAEQRIIDTEHYRRVEEGLGYVARRNNSFSVHVHVGVRGADRAIDVCDRLRAVLPELLALSANSPFLDGHVAGLHSARSQIFTRSFPRCGIPDPLGSWSRYARYVDLLVDTRSIVEHTQLWWSVRPHHTFGTVEVRICDAQSTAEEASALSGLMVACVAQAALDHDDGVPHEPPPNRLLEENVWRAIRYGLDGELIDFDRRATFPAHAVGDRLLEWTAPARARLGIEPVLGSENGAQRQRRRLEEGATIEEVFALEVAATQATYGGVEVRS